MDKKKFHGPMRKPVSRPNTVSTWTYWGHLCLVKWTTKERKKKKNFLLELRDLSCVTVLINTAVFHL